MNFDRILKSKLKGVQDMTILIRLHVGYADSLISICLCFISIFQIVMIQNAKCTITGMIKLRISMILMLPTVIDAQSKYIMQETAWSNDKITFHE